MTLTLPLDTVIDIDSHDGHTGERSLESAISCIYCQLRPGPCSQSRPQSPDHPLWPIYPSPAPLSFSSHLSEPPKLSLPQTHRAWVCVSCACACMFEGAHPSNAQPPRLSGQQRSVLTSSAGAPVSLVSCTSPCCRAFACRGPSLSLSIAASPWVRGGSRVAAGVPFGGACWL